MEQKLEIKLVRLKRFHLLLETALSAVALLIIVLLPTACLNKKNTNTPNKSKLIFSFNLPRELHSLDPLLLRGTAKRFVLFNLHRGLFYYDSKNHLVAYGAQSCIWSSKNMEDCRLANHKWSDGSLIEAKHYVYTYNQILNLNDESLEVTSGIDKIIALKKDQVRFVFKKHFKDVDHRLSSILLTPRKQNRLYISPEEQTFSGPYKLETLTKSQIVLSPNKESSFFKNRLNQNLIIKGIFVDDPTAALNMFDAGRLSFLRYLESSNVKSYQNIYFSPFAKLDGLILSKDAFTLDERKALILSLDFKKLQRIYQSPSQPGCVETSKLFGTKEVPCLDFDKLKALEFYKRTSLNKKTLSIHIPSTTTNEYKSLALWAQAEWKKNLNLDVKIKTVEAKVFHEAIKKSKYDIYRKAQPLVSLSCLDVLQDLSFDKDFGGYQKYKTCPDFFEKVLADAFWIPLGLPYYAHLPSKKFSGYYINLLGQFGLEHLNLRKK